MKLEKFQIFEAFFISFVLDSSQPIFGMHVRNIIDHLPATWFLDKQSDYELHHRKSDCCGS